MKSLVVSAAALAGALAIACAPKHVPQPAPGAAATVVLLKDADGSTGRVHVFNELGSADLTVERQSTVIRVNAAPGPVTTLSEADVDAVCGKTLSALPAIPRRFTLNFRFESEELTDGSRAVVPEVLKAVKEYAVPEVVVIGHTDTLGTPQANIDLGLKRATTVRDILVQAGLEASTIEVRSHGEGDPLIRTPDSTREPRNRRVEISVR
jgi:outer membrane protein OmpA-like peptidoglycan-associated protein